MYFNATTLRVLQVFVGSIGESFTLREVARLAQMHISLAHRATRPLVDRGIVVRDKHKHLLLNYKTNTEMLSLAEYERRDDLLSKKKYEEIRLCSAEIMKKIDDDSFVLLLFGSIVDSEKPRDIDLLLIVDSVEKIEFHEKFLRNIVAKYGLPFEERVLAFENVYEMFAKREEMNVMNQLLKKHIILYGGELFYRLLQRGRI